MESKLHAWEFPLAVGIISGLCVFLTMLIGIFDITIWIEYSELALTWLIAIYGSLGVSDFTWMSAILATIHGFIDAFIFTWLIVILYNKFID